MRNSSFWRGVLVLSGTTIGIGFFSLPFIVYHTGLVLGLICFFLASLVNLFLNIIYGQVVLRTAGDHQLSGYGKIYWGKWGGALGTLTIAVALYGALLAYLVKVGDVLYFFLPFAGKTTWSLIFFFLMGVIVWRGIKLIAVIDYWLSGGIILMIVFLIAMAFPHIDFTNFMTMPSDMSFFKALPIFFFSLAGAAVIPEVEEVLRSSREKVVSAITLGSLLPPALYILFVLAVIGVCHGNISEEAVLGLRQLSPLALSLGVLAIFLAIVTSFMSLAFSLSELWHRDFGFTARRSFFLTLSPVLLLYLLGIRNFLDILSVSGGISTFLLAVVVLSCWWKSKKRA